MQKEGAVTRYEELKLSDIQFEIAKYMADYE